MTQPSSDDFEVLDSDHDHPEAAASTSAPLEPDTGEHPDEEPASAGAQAEMERADESTT
jgi:hypothetical protein